MPLNTFRSVMTFLLLGTAIASFGQTTDTQAGSNGLWNTAANWTNGVPAAGGTATVNKTLTINTNISVSGGGTYTINSATTDLGGAPAYTLSISGSGPSHGVF